MNKISLCKKRFGGAILTALLIIGILFGAHTAYAAELEPDWDDPDYVKMMEHQDSIGQEEEETGEDILTASCGTTTADPYTDQTYDHGDKLDSARLLYGLDISKWQPEVDWSQVKDSGASFVILRIGYSTTSSGTLSADPYFDGGNDAGVSHYYDAKAQDLKIGIYYFSQATTVDEAKAEAEYTLELLGDKEIDLPIVFDYETSENYRNYGLSAAEGTDICKAYCEVITAAGYDAMIYANKTYLTSYLNMSELEQDYRVWIARYNTYTGYDGAYEFWQYTSSGCVPGIEDNVDCNFWYLPNDDVLSNSSTGSILLAAPDEVVGKAATKTSIALTWDHVEGAEGYEILRSDSYSGTYSVIAETEDASYTDAGLVQGREYYYKVRAYAVENDFRTEGKASSVMTVYTPLSISYTLKTTIDLNMRAQAGTEYEILGSLDEGDTVTLVAVTRRSNGDVWYRVKGTISGEELEGYISGLYSKYVISKVTSLTGEADTTTSVNVTWTKQSGVTGYQIYRADNLTGTYKKIATVSASKHAYLNTGLTKYAQYYYKVRSYIKVDGVVTYGSFSKVSILGGKGTSFKVKVTAAAKMNYYTGSSFKKLTALPKGTILKAKNRTLDSKGVWWYYCTGTVNGKNVAGYVSTAYLKKVS